MRVPSPSLRLLLLGATCLLMACQPSLSPFAPPDPTPSPPGLGAASKPVMTFQVEATDRLRGRPVTALRVEVDGVRAEQRADGTWSAAVDPAAEHTVRLTRPSFLPLTYKGPFEEGSRLMARLSPSGVRVVGVGDSLTAGLKVDLADRFVMNLVGRIQAARPGFWVDFVDKGRSGDTYETAEERLNDDVLTQNPDITLVEFGTNDVYDTPLESFPETMDALLRPIKEVSPAVLVADIPYKPRWYGDWNDHAAPYNRAIAEGARRNGAQLVPFSKIFRAAAQGGQWDLFAHDDPYDTTQPDTQFQGDLHPNAAGNKLMAEAFAEAILALTTPDIELATPSLRSP